MKRILYASFFTAFAALSLTSCMNGDYDADPASVSTTINPLTQTNTNGSGGGSSNTSFTWSGTDPMSCKLDGAGWQAESSRYEAPAPGFPATVVGYGSDNSVIRVNIPTNATLNTTYSFGNNLTGTYMTSRTTSDPSNIYAAAQGGNGQVQVTEEDASHIKGKFYFTAKNTSGASKTVNEGYFNIQKQ